MTVRELISELQKMPQDATVTMWADLTRTNGDICWVEKRYEDMVFLNDAYYTPYYEEDN